MNERYSPFLGTTTDRDKAFPGIKSLNIKISQDSYGFRSSPDRKRESVYSKSNIPSHEKCGNPLCQQGGLSLQNIVWFHSNGKHTFYCNGHEGSPKGRRIGPRCDNVFVVNLTVEKEKVASDN